MGPVSLPFCNSLWFYLRVDRNGNIYVVLLHFFKSGTSSLSVLSFVYSCEMIIMIYYYLYTNLIL